MRSITGRSRTIAAAVALAAVAAGAAGGAQAQDPAPPTAAIDGDVLVVRGGPGADKMGVSIGADAVFVQGAQPGPGCAANAGGVVCNRGGVASLDVDTGGGDDELIVRPAATAGGAGAPLPGRVLSGPGNDKVSTGANGFAVDLGDGDDQYSAGNLAPASLTGGAGKDSFSVSSTTTAGWVVRLDGKANDGPTGATTSNVAATFEQLSGGQADDVIDATGVGYAVRVAGGPGNDRLTGGKGADTLAIDAGADTVAGGPGVDTFNYGPAKAGISLTLDNKANDGRTGEKDNVARDIERLGGTNFADIMNLSGSSKSGYLVAGGPGADSITDGTGANSISAGSGTDTVKTASDAFSGVDKVNCGSGQDSARIDVTDKSVGCEKVTKVNDVPR